MTPAAIGSTEAKIDSLAITATKALGIESPNVIETVPPYVETKANPDRKLRGYAGIDLGREPIEPTSFIAVADRLDPSGITCDRAGIGQRRYRRDIGFAICCLLQANKPVA